MREERGNRGCTESPLSPLESRAPYAKELAVAPWLWVEGTGMSPRSR